MIKINPKNERIKRQYFEYEKEANQKSDSTINNIRKAIQRYEEYTKYQDFCTFNKEKAIAFKKRLIETKSKQNNKKLSKSTLLSTLNNLKMFFKWLACQRGYKSKIDRMAIDYLNLSEKDTRAAKSTGFKEFPTLEQIRKVIFTMPTQTEVEKRNQALIAFTILTGIRDGAMASLKLKHVDVVRELVKQDPREVRTKFSKRIDTFFFPVGDDIKAIVIEWIRYLIEEKLYGFDDPLFPRTRLMHDKNYSFAAGGIEPVAWTSANQIRQIFKQAFSQAGVLYFNPHKFRDTLVHMAEKLCRNPEEFKAWSQNLGHENVSTTFTSYGNIDVYRQGEVIQKIGKESADSSAEEKLDLILKKLS